MGKEVNITQVKNKSEPISSDCGPEKKKKTKKTKLILQGNLCKSFWLIPKGLGHSIEFCENTDSKWAGILGVDAFVDLELKRRLKINNSKNCKTSYSKEIHHLVSEDWKLSVSNDERRRRKHLRNRDYLAITSSLSHSIRQIKYDENVLVGVPLSSTQNEGFIVVLSHQRW